MFHTVTAAERIIQTLEYEGAPGEVSLDCVTFEDRSGLTHLASRGHQPLVIAPEPACGELHAHGVERECRWPRVL